MKNSIRNIFFAGLLLAVTHGVSADEPYNWYTAFGFGPAFLNDQDTVQAGITITSEFDTGGAFFASIGRSFDNFRAEGEFYFGINQVTAMTGNGITIDTEGDFTTSGLMLNGYYDFPTGSKWRPYLGGGIGFANLSYNYVTLMGVPAVNDDDYVLAYQGKAGIAYSFSSRWDGTLGYRYLGTGDADFVDATGFPFTADGVQMHVIEIGVRHRW
jgi:opacity protein-like surface antigen